MLDHYPNQKDFCSWSFSKEQTEMLGDILSTSQGHVYWLLQGTITRADQHQTCLEPLVQFHWPINCFWYFSHKISFLLGAYECVCLFNLCSLSISIIKSELDLKNNFFLINETKNSTIGPSKSRIKHEFYSFLFMLLSFFFGHNLHNAIIYTIKLHWNILAVYFFNPDVWL